jgi:hypothetical protein
VDKPSEPIHGPPSPQLLTGNSILTGPPGSAHPSPTAGSGHRKRCQEEGAVAPSAEEMATESAPSLAATGSTFAGASEAVAARICSH